jgi:hypothetical protein
MIPAATIVATTTKDFFGTAIAIAGHINGDGFADIILRLRSCYDQTTRKSPVWTA